MKRHLLLVFSLFATLFARPESRPVPGGVVVLEAPAASLGDEVRFAGHRGLLFKEGKRRYALAPVPLSAEPGLYTLRIVHQGKTLLKRSVTIEKAAYAEQRLTIKNRRKVTPDPDDLRRIRAEAPRKRKAKAYRSTGWPDVSMVWPAEGPVSSTFGLRRFLNGKPRSPHRGIDIAAPAGAPVRAAADGVVVEAGNFFFSGNLVFIEHGQGLTTLYAHLKRFTVRPGERVRKGQVVGYVGSTGRVTGPHLHFSTLVNGVYVDPSIFLSQ
jgi:murein DD-endopeptidase MepM/ murein hydrolase activator NlpD